MARQGEFGELDPGLPQAQAELAIAVRDLILQTEFSIWKVAQKLGVDKGVISRLASGARKRSPDLRLIKDLHDLAITRTERTDRSAEVIPWEHLEAMCSLRPAGLPVVAVPAVCGSCGTTCVPCSSGLTAAFDLETAAIQQEIGGALVAPVPRKEGDRRNAESHDLAWPAAELVAEYLAAGDLPRANGLLRHAASSVPPAETAMAISSCRVVGVPDAAEAIVVQAKLRGPIGVMEIAYHLIETSSYADASALLRSGVEFSGGGAA